MRLLVAEDEIYAFKYLLNLLKEIGFTYGELTHVHSLSEFRKALNKDPHFDLMLLDIQLRDGNSLKIFDEFKITNPVIFITAYDNFVIDSFKAYNLNYILKPVSKDQLSFALGKYFDLMKYYKSSNGEAANVPQRERIILRKGNLRTSMLINDIAFFYAESGLIFGVDFNGERYFLDYNLNQVELLIDKKKFFRLNRQVIANISAIKEFKSIEFSKIEVWLSVNKYIKLPITVSQFTAPDFKWWIDNL